MPSQDNFLSRFATSAKDLELVLDIRRAYFKDAVVSPDESYHTCHSRNTRSMKIIYRNGDAEGYWSLIPVTEGAYKEFLKGHYSHGQMLSDHCLPWTEVQQASAFIYIVGAVVRHKSPGLGKRIERQVILDWLAFIVRLLERINVRGMCGYPSRDSGQKLFEKFGFKSSGVLIDNDPKQPIFYLRADLVTSLKARLNNILAGNAEIPEWDSQDQNDFWHALSSPRRVSFIKSQ